MKKMIILGMTVLILSLAFVGCGGDGDDSTNTTGGLTITGLGDYDGNYAYATGSTQDSSIYLVGVSSTGKTALISGGSVVLTVRNSASQAVYTGNDAAVFSVAIYNTEVAAGPSMGSPVTSGSISVTFNNGIASGTFTTY